MPHPTIPPFTPQMCFLTHCSNSPVSPQADWHSSAAPASAPVSTAPPGPPEPTVLPEYGQGAGLSAQLSKQSCLPQDRLLHLPSEIPLVDTRFPGAARLPFYLALPTLFRPGTVPLFPRNLPGSCPCWAGSSLTLYVGSLRV